VDTAQVLVTLGGIVLIVFILWFFLGSREGSPP